MTVRTTMLGKIDGFSFLTDINDHYSAMIRSLWALTVSVDRQITVTRRFELIHPISLLSVDNGQHMPVDELVQYASGLPSDRCKCAASSTEAKGRMIPRAYLNASVSTQSNERSIGAEVNLPTNESANCLQTSGSSTIDR